ncbi:Sec-independent protein translocase protein TatB [Endozoicomonas lisbonensis]|uniref:Tat protein translocase TatB subunit n=1 Tax=Endozoicomonas lisbonensis TaxID=3120522 RepID=A0ABV2SB53_9GAMM
MLDSVGFFEILVVMTLGLLVIGPERLPVVIKQASDWVRVVRGSFTSLAHQYEQELKMKELKQRLDYTRKKSLEAATKRSRSLKRDDI